MDKKKIARLRKRLEKLRGVGGVRSSELVRLAAQVGRSQHPRGKEPTWVSDMLPDARPLSIPGHRKLNRITARSILDRLEEDLDMISERLEVEES